MVLAALMLGLSPETDLQRDVRALATEMRREIGAPAVYLGIAIDGEIRASVALGECKLGSAVPFTSNDPVMIGSVSKPVAGFVVSQLVAKGKLKWQSELGQIVPEFRDVTDSRLLDATLEQLLSHTAGLPTKPYQDEYREKPSDTPRVWRRGYCLDYLRTDLLSRPGERFAYANGGLMFAAEMAEAVTSEDFNATEMRFLKEDLGLKTPMFGEFNGDNARPTPTSGHVYRNGSGDFVKYSDDWRTRSPRWKASPSGNLTMSCEDTLRFAAAASTDYREVAGIVVPKEGWDFIYRPASNVTKYSRSAWQTWSGGLWHGGNSGRGECMSAQVNRKGRTAAILYTNMNYEDKSFNIDPWTHRLLALTASATRG